MTGVFSRILSAGLVVVGLVATPVYSAIAENSSTDGRDKAAPKDFFAVVDGETISMHEFEMAYQAGMRKRFYHGKVPEEQLNAFREDVKNTLIQRVLLLQEAKRRGISADEARVAAQLQTYEQRYSSRPDWAQYREEILKGLRAALEEEDSLRLLEQSVKASPSVDDAMVKKFYEENPELFTTPERVKVSVILLRVAPSSSAEVWEAAFEEGNQLVAKLKRGADFAELARIHSGDPSAASGGELGYVHEGMLSPQAEQVINKLGVQDISDPVMMLRGVAVFRLDAREQAKLNTFADVSDRASKLLERELAEKAWRDLLVQLRAKADIKMSAAF